MRTTKDAFPRRNPTSANELWIHAARGASKAAEGKEVVFTAKWEAAQEEVQKVDSSRPRTPARTIPNGRATAMTFSCAMRALTQLPREIARAGRATFFSAACTQGVYEPPG